MRRNTITLGRHRERDLVELKARTDSSHKPGTVGTQQFAPGKKKEAPSPERLFGTFLATMAQTLGKEATVDLLQQARTTAGQNQAEPCLAVLAHGIAKATLQQMRPNESKQEIRRAAKHDPRLVGMMRLADSAKAYLKARKQGASEQSDEKDSVEALNGYHLAPEKQADLMAKNRESMLKVQKVYAGIADAQRKHLQEISEMTKETSRYIFELQLSAWEKQQASREKHYQEYLKILSGTTATAT